MINLPLFCGNNVGGIGIKHGPKHRACIVDMTNVDPIYEGFTQVLDLRVVDVVIFHTLQFSYVTNMIISF